MIVLNWQRWHNNIMIRFARFSSVTVYRTGERRHACFDEGLIKKWIESLCAEKTLNSIAMIENLLTWAMHLCCRCYIYEGKRNMLSQFVMSVLNITKEMRELGALMYSYFMFHEGYLIQTSSLTLNWDWKHTCLFLRQRLLSSWH